MAEWSLSIFDKFGVKLDMPQVGNLSCSWLMNDVGQMSFTIPIRSNAVRADYIRYGNFVLLEHETAPAWGGVIWTPRQWTPDHVVVKCYDSAFQMRRIYAPADATINGLPGGIFKRMIEFINAFNYDTRVIPGDFYRSGPSITLRTGDYSILEVVRTVQNISRQGWSLTPGFDENNQLIFRASWLQRYGTPVPAINLTEGVNIEAGSSSLTEQGDIYNFVVCFDKGSLTPGASKRGQYRDNESIDTYGLSMLSFQSDSESEDSVDLQAYKFLEYSSNPHIMLDITALDVPVANSDKTSFSFLRVGELANVQLHSVGFYDNNTIGYNKIMRMIGTELNATTNKMRVVMDDAIIIGDTLQ